MTKLLKSPFAFLFLLAVFCMAGAHVACATVAITLLQNGSFGTISAPATISGPQWIQMGGNGVITCPVGWTCPATGTPMEFSITGMVSTKVYDFGCDTGNPMANTTGSGFGLTTLPSTTVFDLSVITPKGPGLGATCTGLANTSILTYTATGTTGTLYVGTKIDATHAQAGGVFNLTNGGNPFNAEVDKSGGGEKTSSNTDITVTFGSLVGFASTVNLAFGEVLYSALPTLTTDFVKLGTNGAATYGGVFSANANTHTITAGAATLNNVQNGVTVQVQCDTTAVMAKSGASGSKITVNGLEVVAQGSIGAYGTGHACAGSGGAVATTMVFNSATANTFYFGGKIDGSTATAFSAGSYSSANSGGTNFNVVVLNQ